MSVSFSLRRRAEAFYTAVQKYRTILFLAEEPKEGPPEMTFRDSADVLVTLVIQRAENAWKLGEEVSSLLCMAA